MDNKQITTRNNWSFNNVAISATTMGLSAIPAELITLPICAVKTNYMAMVKNSAINEQKKYIPTLNMRQVTMDIYNKRGLYGFFNASAPAITSQMISSASKFTLYEGFKHHFGNGDNNFAQNALFGIVSGVSGGLFTAPFDRARALRQYNNGQATKTYGSIGKLFLQKPLEAWRGYGFTFGKNVALYSLLYPGYDLIKKKTGGNAMAASLFTPMIISGILQPIEFARTRHMLNQEWRLGWNPRPYYTGYTLTAGRAIPHFMITMCTMEYLKGIVQERWGIVVKK